MFLTMTSDLLLSMNTKNSKGQQRNQEAHLQKYGRGQSVSLFTDYSWRWKRIDMMGSTKTTCNQGFNKQKLASTPPYNEVNAKCN